MDDLVVNLREEGRRIDGGICKMTEIWNAPLVHIGRPYLLYTGSENDPGKEEASKTSNAAEMLSKSIAELKANLCRDSDESKQNLCGMRKFMEESWNIYEDLKQQCCDIEVLFGEYGYVPVNNQTINREGEVDITIHTTDSEQTQKHEKEFTPYISWKLRMKKFDASTPQKAGRLDNTENIPINEGTPEVSVKELAQKFSKSNVGLTPYQNSPKEPIFSKYYYELVKGKILHSE